MTHPLELIDISKTFNGKPVLRGVSLTVRSGQIVALLGPSGCGKTTTLRLIAGFEWPDTGRIVINGRVVSENGGARVAPEDRRAGMVFQEYALFPHLTCADNIGFGLSGRDKTARVREMLALVGLGDAGERMPGELSGGQQQRIALARALAPKPDILLLDEPFSNLDATLRAQVRTEVRSILKASGITCVFVTHDQTEALSLADGVAVMFEGRVAQVAAPETLYHRPATREVAAFVGEANFLPGEADGLTVETALGQLELADPLHGAVDVMIRPELLRLLPAFGSEQRALDVRVAWREFYGHDQRIGLRVATPNGSLELVARVDAGIPSDGSPFSVGDPVGLGVGGPVRAFVR